MRAPRTVRRDRRLSSRGFFFRAPNEERLPQDDRRGGPARRRGDRDAPDVARRLARTGPLAAEPVRPRGRPRGARRLPGGGRPDPDDQHLGRQPGQADVARVGGLAREDQPRGRAPGARSRGRGTRLRRGLDRPARRARQAVRLPPTDAGPRDLRRAGARASGVRRRSRASRDLRKPPGGGRGGSRRSGTVLRDPDRGRDDVSRGRPHGVRRSGRPGAFDPDARRRRRRRHELHARTAGDPRTVLAGRPGDRHAPLRDAQRGLSQRRPRPQRLPFVPRLPARVRRRFRRGRGRDRRGLLRHHTRAHPRHGARGLGPKAPPRIPTRVGGRRSGGRTSRGGADRNLAPEARSLPTRTSSSSRPRSSRPRAPTAPQPSKAPG